MRFRFDDFLRRQSQGDCPSGEALRLPKLGTAQPDDLSDEVFAANLSDDESFDAELPDDLAELASQLGDEARSLSSLYPCAIPTASPQRVVAQRAPWVRPRAWVRPLAAIAAAAVVIAVALPYMASQPRRLPPPPRNTSASMHVSRPEAPRPSTETVKPTVTNVALPAVIFSSLSGAEQEGILDLLESQPHDPNARIEI